MTLGHEVTEAVFATCTRLEAEALANLICTCETPSDAHACTLLAALINAHWYDEVRAGLLGVSNARLASKAWIAQGYLEDALGYLLDRGSYQGHLRDAGDEISNPG